MNKNITEHELVLNGTKTKVLYEICDETVLVYTEGKHNLFTYSKPPDYHNSDEFRNGCLEHFKKWVEDDF